MTDEAGIIIDDGTVSRLEEHRYFVTTTSSGVAAVEEWLTWWMEGEELCAHVTNVTSGLAAVNLAGPRAREVLAGLTDVDISAGGLPYLRAAQGSIAGVPAILLRIGFVGELGYEIHVPAEYGEFLWDTLMQAGQPFGIAPFGVEAQRTLRLEKGHIIVGQDTDALSTPLAADMAWIVKFDKPDFIGKTSLVPLEGDGSGERLVGFEMVDRHPVPDEGAAIVDSNGYPVGRVTSARYSPALDRVIGLAWVPVSLAAVGADLHIELGDAGRGDGRGGKGSARRTGLAQVVRPPFYDPAGERLKS
jgi:sarcosine oxidase subunit alpha